MSCSSSSSIKTPLRFILSVSRAFYRGRDFCPLLSVTEQVGRACGWVKQIKRGWGNLCWAHRKNMIQTHSWGLWMACGMVRNKLFRCVRVICCLDLSFEGEATERIHTPASQHTEPPALDKSTCKVYVCIWGHSHRIPPASQHNHIDRPYLSRARFVIRMADLGRACCGETGF